MTEPKLCGNCRSWDQYDDRGGKCRLKPPVVLLVPLGDDDMMANTYWPETDRKYGWCEEHSLRPDLQTGG